MTTTADTIRKGYAAFTAGDMEGALSLFSDDVVWDQGGRNQLTGQYKGRDGVTEMLVKLFQLTEGTIHVDVIDVFADERRAIVLAREQGTRPDGRALDCNELHIWDFDADGAVVAFAELNNDDAEHDAFWS